LIARFRIFHFFSSYFWLYLMIGVCPLTQGRPSGLSISGSANIQTADQFVSVTSYFFNTSALLNQEKKSIMSLISNGAVFRTLAESAVRFRNGNSNCGRAHQFQVENDWFLST
jgi:hypothetical protein